MEGQSKLEEISTKRENSMAVGLDEAGRGAVLGPLVIGAVWAHDEQIQQMKELGVRDSKKLTRRKRSELALEIDKLVKWKCKVITADMINTEMETKNLNQIEHDAMIEVIRSEEIFGTLIVDAVGNIKKLRDKLKKELEIKDQEKVIVEYRAERYTVVAAASIMAKVTRDCYMEKLIDEKDQSCSGYPSDKKTRKFLKDYYNKMGKFPDFSRKKWKTLELILNEINDVTTGKTAIRE